MTAARLVALTCFAMIAFAANSVLTRLALADASANAIGFTVIRVVAAAVMLMLMLLWRDRRIEWRGGDAVASLGLFAYMVFFSFAYLSLAAGTGALILFGVVQLTMFGVTLAGGARFGPMTWLGLGLAIAGLVWLVAPGVTAPDPLGTLLMAIAGIGWGVYSLRGGYASDALRATTINFLWIAIPAVIVGVLFSSGGGLSGYAVLMAILSGALASACGYAVWYAVVPALGAGRAAVVQLTVPAIAALGGVLFLSEPLTFRLAAASATILGGVALALLTKERTR